MKDINGNTLFNLIAGHSDYHGNDILNAILIMQEGRELKHIKPISKDATKQAKWIPRSTKKRERIFKCSVCGNVLDFDGVNAGRGDANYCPNCGAKMDEVSE